MTEKEPKKNFYFRGKFFEKEEDFWEYVKTWDSQPVDLQFFRHHLDQAYKMLEMNFDTPGLQRDTNKFAMKLLALHFGFGVE